MQKQLLKIENLSKYFPVYSGVFRRKTGDVKAVDNISFAIDRGEIFGLVGESGCGKSTTGRAILNLIKPTRGRITFNDQVIFDSENPVELNRTEELALRKQMQIIFQDPSAALNPRRTAGQSILEGIKKHNLFSGQEAVEEVKRLLEVCGLDADSYQKYPHEFSGGQKQRISIARALALQPDFVIGDEPIAALDVSIQAQILKLLQELINEYDLTFLFISHDLNVVRYFCDRIAVMYLGSFVEMGSSEHIFSSPLHPYSKALLSAIPSSVKETSKNRIHLSGEVPSPANPPSGCKFHTRCSEVMEICRRENPKLQAIDGGLVACHLYTK